MESETDRHFPGMFSKISQGERESDMNLITSNRIYLSTQSGYTKYITLPWMKTADSQGLQKVLNKIDL